MANELKLKLSVLFSKGGAKEQEVKSVSIDVSGDDFTSSTQLIGTSEEQIVFSADISALGYFIVENLDDTNYVELGISTGVYQVRCRAGRFAIFEPNGDTIYARANTNPVRVKFTAFEL